MEKEQMADSKPTFNLLARFVDIEAKILALSEVLKYHTSKIA